MSDCRVELFKDGAFEMWEERHGTNCPHWPQATRDLKAFAIAHGLGWEDPNASWWPK